MSHFKKYQVIINLLFLGALLGYLGLIGSDLAPYWFNPQWVTDDSFQQVYPFLKVHQPELFAGDLITEVMEGYLAPAHYWLCYAITYLTGDPILMSHWVMLIQVALCIIFFFLFIRKIADFPTACLATIWFVSIRTVFQRMTGGLPRGWAPVILCAFLYFLSQRNHFAILTILLLGCLLNPPATIVVALTYGLFLFWHLFTKERAKFIKPFILLILLSPVYILITFQVVKRPESVGQMVTYQQALEMPGMSRPNGRFPFAPLLDIPTELRLYAFDAFQHRLSTEFAWQKKYLPSINKFLKKNSIVIFLSLFVLLLIIVLFRKRRPSTSELSCYFMAIVLVYWLSRLLAFNLYVPDRHLLIPLGIFWVALFAVLITRGFADREEDRFVQNKLSLSLLIGLGILVALINGDGRSGTANFNYHLYKKGKVFAWLKKNTFPDVLIAGHPQHLDALMMFSERKGYITYETTHPFYPKYFEESIRRNQISLKAHYAETLQEVYSLLAPEGIDYFVFDRRRFYPERLASETYFEPLTSLVKTLTSRAPTEYAYKLIPASLDPVRSPYLIFRDDFSVVIDVKKLGEYLKQEEMEKNEPA